MKLNPDDRIWCPVEKPDYLCVLHGQQRPPQNQVDFLGLQLLLLNRLVDQANEGELEVAERRLRLDFPARELDFLPGGLFHDRRTSRLLLENPSDINGPLHQWKVEFDEVRNLPQMPRQEAREEAEQVTMQ